MIALVILTNVDVIHIYMISFTLFPIEKIISLYSYRLQ